MKSLMIQGTGSDAGKSLFCAGLIRAFKQNGVVALPFKPQNMSNNAAIAEGGDVTGEIGRAQALQAQAAGVPPSVDMNPILLKPQNDSLSQIIVRGQLWGQAGGGDYYKLKPQLLPFVEKSFQKIASLADIVIVEGAGSPAEINLREGDIANMGFATHLKVPVVLLGDIERGGVIANLVGTYHLLPPAERDLIKAFVVNKFRGDVRLFDSAIDIIRDRTGWQFGGIIPWLDSLANLPQEDALGLQVLKSQQAEKKGGGVGGRGFSIGVLQLPHIANFDDLDALRAEASVHLHIIEAGQRIPADVQILIIPGSKATIADTRYLFAQGWDTEIKAFALRGGIIVGLCGGYQMLGHTIEDRYGVEGDKETIEGLGLLDMATVLQGDKQLSKTTAQEVLFGGEVSGYEIHLGRSEGGADIFMRAHDGTAIGHISGDKKIMGCYLHGLFANDEFRHRFLSQLGDHVPSYDSYDGLVENILDQWAEHLERHCDLDLLESLAAEMQ